MQVYPTRHFNKNYLKRPNVYHRRLMNLKQSVVVGLRPSLCEYMFAKHLQLHLFGFGTGDIEQE